jgi:hypothetical protein
LPEVAAKPARPAKKETSAQRVDAPTVFKKKLPSLEPVETTGTLTLEGSDEEESEPPAGQP